MARAKTSGPARGDMLRAIAIASGAIYTVFAVIVAFGGSDASYQVSLRASWAIVMLVAMGTFAIGSTMYSGTHGVRTAEDTPILTLVN
jgi:hypothetical protein